jgi:hypothetical protein
VGDSSKDEGALAASFLRFSVMGRRVGVGLLLLLLLLLLLASAHPAVLASHSVSALASSAAMDAERIGGS